MVKTRKLYPCLALVVAIICLILLSNCGGGGNSTIVPSSAIIPTENAVSYTNPTPTPVLTNVSVSGYIYGNNITTGDGETVPRINVLDVPACQADSSGNEPFTTQVSNTLQQDYPEDWAKADVQELYAQLNKTLSESKPLPECNGQVYSVYSENPIPVGSDGHFDNTVLTGAADSNVKLEVALGEDNYADVETLPSSGSINSSDATSAVLKSCPEKIFAFPGEIVIFKVYSEPGINLKSAGLKFTLNNPSIGCITQPVYLCLFGAHKYQVAYGCVYIKPVLDTPVDTTILAKLNSGQSMSIFLEVIKKTASVSGTVYTGGSPLVKGYVKSLGPKACCKIDENGNYSLPKVFRGHSRTVIATYWTMEDNGQKVKHREERVIDFLNADVTGFNFGVPPTPNPTPTRRPPYDEFYNKKVSTVLYQYNQWEAELDKLEANQRIIKWLNGQLPDGPPIPEEIAGATSIGNPYDIWVEFKDGMSICISTSDPIVVEEQDVNEPLPRKEEIKPLSRLTSRSDNSTVKNADVIMLSPYDWQYPYGAKVEKQIKENLIANNYNVKCITTHMGLINLDIPDDIYFDWDNPIKDNLDIQDPNRPLINCYMTFNGNWDNILSPDEFETIGKYGIIYINAHGGPINVDEDEFNPDYPGTTSFRMSCTLDVKKWFGLPSKIDTWVLINDLMNYNPNTGEINDPGWWFYRYRKIADTIIQSDGTHKKGWVRELALTNKYFDHLNANPTTNFEDSLVYWCGCCSWHLKDSFNSAKVYVGYDRFSYSTWAYPFAYDFFWFMMYGNKGCPNINTVNGKLNIPYAPLPEGTPSFDPNKPLNTTEALNALTNYYKVNPDPNPYTDPGVEDRSGFGCTAKEWQKDPNEHIYFPVPVTVTIEKK